MLLLNECILMLRDWPNGAQLFRFSSKTFVKKGKTAAFIALEPENAAARGSEQQRQPFLLRFNLPTRKVAAAATHQSTTETRIVEEVL